MAIKNLIRLVLVTALLLLIPLISMQFIEGMAWSPFDFIIAGVLLFGTGLAYELISRRGATTAYRIATGLMVATALFLIWVNLAVGIIGSEDNPANTLYLGVLIVLLLGAILANFKARGMSRTLFVAAAAQTAVPFIALTIWQPAITVEVL
ncbi:MAG TPA: hypothetical protein VEA36_02550 [Candidatus Paceibacterota bacterium]|nr:hypothetical protein [Candidatus Paceibacterota bacterium]